MQISHSDKSPHRPARLHKVRRMVAEILGLSLDHIDMLIDSLYDDKGVLSVNWRGEAIPSQRSRCAVEYAWEECGEARGKVVHLNTYDEAI